MQFNDDHAFNRTLLKFEELTKKYYGKPVNFVLHRNSELGLEKDYFVYLNQGKAWTTPSSRRRTCPRSRARRRSSTRPFLFRDLDHWRKVLDADLFKPIAEEVAKKADVMLIGYAGGGTRNIFRQQAAAQSGGPAWPQGPGDGRPDLDAALLPRWACRLP